MPKSRVDEKFENTGIIFLRERTSDNSIPEYKDSISIYFTNAEEEISPNNIDPEKVTELISWISSKHRDMIGIQCEFISQGAAFARFLSKIYGLDFPYDIPYFNTSIYTKLLTEYIKQTKGEK